MRKLTKTLAAMSLLIPVAAYPLGIGDIKLHSALNQKLNAEIALSLAVGEELKDIKISLASPDKFDKAGIAWSYFLSEIQFKPILQTNGKVVIQVTSNAIVQEPYLDFLVEVSWPKGSVLKEFTVLVDPPVTYQTNTIATPSTKPVTKPTNKINSLPVTTGNDLSRLSVAGEYGPTTRYDSLWKVAERVNKESHISVEQMMMALYKANPRAFYKKNVNALMAGKILKIPAYSEIVALSKKQARAQFSKQMAVWEGKAIAAPDIQVADTHQQTTNQLTLVAPVEEKLNRTAVLATHGENTQNLSTENTQLQERLDHLEKQFALMQEMLAIKDQQLAALQKAQNISKVQVQPNEITAKKPIEKTELASKAVSKDSVVNTRSESDKIATDQGAVTTAPRPIVKKAPEITAPPVTEVSSGTNYYYLGFGIFGLLALSGLGFVLWRRRQAEAIGIDDMDTSSMFASSSEIILPKDDDEDGFVPPVFDETPSYEVGTVGESSFLSEFTPSDFDVLETGQAEVDPTSEADVYLAYGRYLQAEELMRHAIEESPDRDDFKLKLLEIFYASENGKAFENFSKELSDQGKREDQEFWTKVSEMGSEILPESPLFSAESHESVFESNDNISDNELLVKDSIGAEGKTDAVVNQEPVDNEVNNEIDNASIDFDLSSFSLMDSEEASQETKEAVQDDDIESIDFDLSSFSEVVENKPPVTEEGHDNELETFDFDRDNSVEQQKPAEISIDDIDDSIETSAFNDNEASDEIRLDDFDRDNSVEQQKPAEISIDDIDDSIETSAFNDNEASDEIRLDDFGLSTAEQSVEVDESKEDVKTTVDDENNDFDFDFDFDSVPTEASESDSLVSEDDLMVSDLTDMDEFETKIDLAKAYMDMGDKDSAKEILQEVLEKGRDAQKTEAQAMIDKLVD